MTRQSVTVAVVGATGVVGRTMIQVLIEREFPMHELRLLASGRSAGRTVDVGGRALQVGEAVADVVHGEVGDRVAARLVKQENVLAIGDPLFALPGSTGACRDAWDEILVHQLDYRYRPCNFVELMPRLDEHLRRPKAQGATV